jgi:hypothetical protein
MLELRVAAAATSPLQVWILRSQKEILALQAGTKQPGSIGALDQRGERPSPSLVQ